MAVVVEVSKILAKKVTEGDTGTIRVMMPVSAGLNADEIRPSILHGGIEGVHVLRQAPVSLNRRGNGCTSSSTVNRPYCGAAPVG